MRTRGAKKKKHPYFQDDGDVGGEGLNAVEAGDESDGQESFLVHLPPQEEIALQVVQAEVVLTAAKQKGQRLALHAKVQIPPLVLFCGDQS